MNTLRTAIFYACLCTLLASATAAAKNYTTVPWHKLKPSKTPLELHSLALELRDYANAGDVQTIYYALHAAHFNSRQVIQIEERLQKPDFSLFSKKELSEIAKRLYASIETQFSDLFNTEYAWEFIHHRKFGKRHFLLFRIENGAGAYDYIDLEFMKQKRQWLLIDWYTRSTDTWGSALFSRAFQLTFNAQQHPGKHSKNLLEFLNPPGKNFIDLFDNLSPEQKRDPMLQAFLVGHTARYFPENIPDAKQRLTEWSEPDRYLIFKFNHAYEQENIRNALFLCQQLQKQLGHDDNLALMQAELLYQLGEYRKADKLVAHSIRNHRDSQRVFYTALILFGYYEKYQQAVMTLNILNNDFGLDLDKNTLKEISGMEPFIASLEFKNWLAQRD